jgi:pseudaminic acid synthase
MHIGARTIGPGHPVYLIAEMSANHQQSLDRAREIVRAAKEAGADAIKLQTYTPDTMTIDCDNPHFRIAGTQWNGQTLYSLYRQAYAPWEWQPAIKGYAEELGLDCFSTPFDATSVAFLERMAVPAYKVASFELVDLPLLVVIGATHKPVILSTGMARLAEIDEAVRTLHAAGTPEIALLKCTSAYPAPPDEMNLSTIPDLARVFDVPVGLSDHTLGIAGAVAAVALGACIIEKHFTLSRADGGPDSAFSLEPHEFRELAAAVRTAERSLGQVQYAPTPHEAESLVFRRSLFVVRDVRKGEPFTLDNVRSIRPGHGLAPKHLPQVLGRVASRDVARGTPLQWDLVG